MSDSAAVPPQRPEVLFRLLWDGGLQTVGQPLHEGTGQAILQFTPATLRLLLRALSPAGIDALTLVIEHAYRPGEPVVIEGWSSRWLREHGMGKTAAERAVTELQNKGYIRGERSQQSVIGARKFGVVPAGVLQEVGREPGTPYLSGRKPGPARAARSAGDPVDSPVSGFPRNGEAGSVDDLVSGEPRNEEADPVDSFISGSPRNQEHGMDVSISGSLRDAEARFLGLPETEKDNSQVSLGSGVPGNQRSTPPTRSSKEEGKNLPSPERSSGGALTRDHLREHLRDGALRARLAPRQDAAVLAVAGALARQREQARHALEFFGRTVSPTPELDLALWLVELLLVDDESLVATDAALVEHMRTAGVQVPASTSADLVVGVVVSTLVAMDTKVASWVRWMAAGLRKQSWHQSETLTAVLRDLDRALALPAPSHAADGSAREVQPAGGTAPAGGTEPPAPLPAGALRTAAAAAFSPGESAEDRLDRLRQAAVGTAWEDDIAFQTLLRNPGRQEWVLLRWEQRRAAGA